MLSDVVVSILRISVVMASIGLIEVDADDKGVGKLENRFVFSNKDASGVKDYDRITERDLSDL